MKYLKKYNENVEKKSLEDVKDILIELEDDEFEIIWYENEYRFVIIKNGGFIYDDIKEVILRLKDYLFPNRLSIIAYVKDFFSSIEYDSYDFDENHLIGTYKNEEEDIYKKEDITDAKLLCVTIKFKLKK